MEYGTRQNPLPLGREVNFTGQGRSFWFQVVSVQRNATAAAMKVNQFSNPEPPAGNSYIMVELLLTYLKGDESKPYHTTDSGFTLYADNRLWGAPSDSIAPEPQFVGQDIFPGARVVGWLPPKYLPANLMDSAELDIDNYYFALKGAPSSTGAALPSTPLAPTSIPPSPSPTLASNPNPADVARVTVQQADLVWASVVAQNGAPTSDLDQVYGGAWLAEVRTSVESMRAKGQYRVARMTAPIVVQSAQWVSGGRIEAFVTEEWDDRVYNGDGSLAQVVPGHVEQRYVLENSGDGWLIVESQMVRS